MAQQCVVSGGDDSAEAESLSRDGSVANCIDVSMQRVQPARGLFTRDLPARIPELGQLPSRNDSVLSLGECCGPVLTSILLSHTGNKGEVSGVLPWEHLFV